MNPRAAIPCVLIVDDQPANVRVLAEALQGAYDLRFATDASRALAKVLRCGSASMCGGTPKILATSLTEKFR